MKEPIKIRVEFSVLYKTLLMVEMRSKIFKEAQYKFWKLLTSFLWPCKVIESSSFWFLLHWNFYASVIHLSFWKIMPMWLLIDHCIVVCAVIVVFTLCYVMTSMINILLVELLTQVIIEMCMLWLVKDYITSYHNHREQGDYSRSPKFQNGCLTFCQMFVREW